MRHFLSWILFVCVGCSCSTPRATQKASTTPKASSSPMIEVEDGLYIIHFEGTVDEDSADVMQKALAVAGADSSVKNILIEINSPGGSVPAGMAIAKAIENTTTPLTCVVDGEAASMAFYILQSCPQRTMTRRSLLMIHGPSLHMELNGPYVKWQNIADALLALEKVMVAHMAARLRINADQLGQQIANGREIWLNWESAMALGAVDSTVDRVEQARKDLHFPR